MGDGWVGGWVVDGWWVDGEKDSESSELTMKDLMEKQMGCH